MVDPHFEKSFKDNAEALQVYGGILEIKSQPTDLASLANSTYSEAINTQAASSAWVETIPLVEVVDTPTAGDGVTLPVTSATSSEVEISLSEDKYAKVSVNRLQTRSSTTLRNVGVGIGRAMVKETNKEFLSELATGGEQVYLGQVGKNVTAVKLWSMLNEMISNLDAEGYDPSDINLVVNTASWAVLSDGITNLSSAVNSKERAVDLLGINKLVKVKSSSYTVGGGDKLAVASFFHKDAVAAVKRVDDIRVREGDGADYVIARYRSGYKTLEVPASVTLFEGTAA